MRAGAGDHLENEHFNLYYFPVEGGSVRKKKTNKTKSEVDNVPPRQTD